MGDRRILASGVALCALLASATAARAGCFPVGFAPTTQHAQCPGALTPDGAAIALGAIDDPSSSLHTSGLMASIDTAAVLERDAPADRNTLMVSGELLARVNPHPWLTFYGAATYAKAEAASHYLAARVGGGIRLVTEHWKTYRRATAIRAELSKDLLGDGAALAALRPADALRLPDGLRGQAIVEGRYELIGCYAPFVHVEAGVRLQRGDRYLTIPVGITIGANRSVGDEYVMLFGGYHVDVTQPQGVISSVHRLRLGAQTTRPVVLHMRVGGVVEIFLADPDGAYLGVTLEMPLVRN